MGDKEVEELLVVKHCTDLSELGGEPVTFCYNCRRLKINRRHFLVSVQMDHLIINDHRGLASNPS